MGVDRRPKRDPLHFDQAPDLEDSSGNSLHDIGTARDPRRIIFFIHVSRLQA